MLNNEQLEKQLEILSELKAVDTDEFFYTRLRSRMEKEVEESRNAFKVKPHWVLALLLIMLFFNGWILIAGQHNSATLSNNDGLASLAIQYETNMILNY